MQRLVEFAVILAIARSQIPEGADNTETHSNACILIHLRMGISLCTLSRFSKSLDRQDRISFLLWKPHKSIIGRRPGKLHTHHRLAVWCIKHRMDNSQEILFLVSSEKRQAKGGNKLNYATMWTGTITVRDSRISPTPDFHEQHPKVTVKMYSW